MRYADCISRTDAECRNYDVGRLNLECAVGLPGSEYLCIDAATQKLDEWAAVIRQATLALLPKFHAAPERYENSESHFRMLVFVTVLQRDLGVLYDPACISGAFDASDSRTQFIHGILYGSGGTCTSLPILYLALGLRLGYPLHLVETKQHYFVRWEDSASRCNVECTSRGLVTRADDEYRTFPLTWTDFDRRHGRYLQNLSSRELLGCFIHERAHVLLDNRRYAEAVQANDYARQLRPDHPLYQQNYLISSAVQQLAMQETQGRFTTLRGQIPELMPTHRTGLDPRLEAAARRELQRIEKNRRKSRIMA